MYSQKSPCIYDESDAFINMQLALYPECMRNGLGKSVYTFNRYTAINHIKTIVKNIQIILSDI